MHVGVDLLWKCVKDVVASYDCLDMPWLATNFGESSEQIARP